MKPLPVKYLLVGLVVAAVACYLTWSFGAKAGEQAGKNFCTDNLWNNA